MRITKKFAGASCIGKQVFQPCDETFSGEHSQPEIEELLVLEETFYCRVGDRSCSGEWRGFFTLNMILPLLRHPRDLIAINNFATFENWPISCIPDESVTIICFLLKPTVR